MNAHLENALILSRLILKFGQTFRITEDAHGNLESDTTHTLMLALLAGELTANEAIHLDRAAVVEMALIHDLPEVYAGDTPTLHLLSDDQKAAKEAREQAALERIREELAAFPWILETLERYERQACPESRFVRYIDKVLPKLTHRDNGCKVSRASGQTLEAAKARNAIQIQEYRASHPEFTLAGALLEAAAADSHEQWEAAEQLAGALAPSPELEASR